MKYAILKVQEKDWKNLKLVTKYQIAQEIVSATDSTRRISIFKEVRTIKTTHELSSNMLLPFNGKLPSFTTYEEAQKYVDLLISENPSDNSQIVYQVKTK